MHQRRYGRAELRRKVEHAGFGVQRITSSIYDLIPNEANRQSCLTVERIRNQPAARRSLAKNIGSRARDD